VNTGNNGRNVQCILLVQRKKCITVERGNQKVWLQVCQTDSVRKGISGFGKSFWKEREASNKVFSKLEAKCEEGCGHWRDCILVANIYWLLAVLGTVLITVCYFLESYNL